MAAGEGRVGWKQGQLGGRFLQQSRPKREVAWSGLSLVKRMRRRVMGIYVERRSHRIC